MIDNPQWLELQRRLAEFRQCRQQLLTDRTPLHPAVEEIDVRIADAEKQLTTTQRQIPNPQARNRADLPATDKRIEEAAAVAHADRRAAERVANENQQKLRDLAAAVERRAQARDAAELAETRAVRRQQAGPQLVVEYAKVVQDPPVQDPQIADYGWRPIWSAGGLRLDGLRPGRSVVGKIRRLVNLMSVYKAYGRCRQHGKPR